MILLIKKDPKLPGCKKASGLKSFKKSVWFGTDGFLLHVKDYRNILILYLFLIYFYFDPFQLDGVCQFSS